MEKHLTSLPSTQKWFLKKYLVIAMPCIASVEGDIDREQGKSA